MLLAGYCYSHLLSTRLGLRRQIIVHCAVMLLPFLFLPFALTGWRPSFEVGGLKRL